MMEQMNLFNLKNKAEKIEKIKNLRVGSCFSGVGMWELGLKYAEIKHTQEFFIEWDKFPAASYKAIHGDVKHYSDATKVVAEELSDIDLFFYSPPCQAFSVAGKGLGANEERGLLFNDALRIIKTKKPKICIMENVKGLTNKKHKDFFNHILDSLERAGYTNNWKILNTKDYGIPQNRERIFIVSIRNDIYNGFEFPKKFDNGVRLKHLLEKDVDEKFYVSEEKCAKLIEQIKDKETVMLDMCQAKREGKPREYKNYSPTLSARDYKEPRLIKEVAIPCITPDRIKKRQNGRKFKEDSDPMFTLTSQDRHGVMVKEATKKGYAIATEGDSINLEQPSSLTRRGRVGKQVAQTLTCSCNQAVVEPKYRIRKLTPKEVFRLQGIKDEDFDKAAKVNSNSQLYKQAGNGVSVNVVKELINKLKEKGYI